MNKSKEKTKAILLKEKEMEILLLLYRFRFLNRVQIQTMLGHKYRSKVQEWLNSLVVQGCIKKDYSKEFAGEAAIYYLAPSGRKQLKNNPKVKAKLLDGRVWREEERTKEFRDHCLFIANIYLSLNSLATSTRATLTLFTKTDLYGRNYIVKPLPDAYFAITSQSGKVKRYFLDSFDDIPSAQLRKRVQRYLGFYDSDKWFEQYPDRSFPEIIFICHNNRAKGHLFYYIQSQLDEYLELSFYITTNELVKKKGLIKEVLEKVIAEV